MIGGITASFESGERFFGGLRRVAPSIPRSEFLGFGGQPVEDLGSGVVILSLVGHQVTERKDAERSSARETMTGKGDSKIRRGSKVGELNHAQNPVRFADDAGPL